MGFNIDPEDLEGCFVVDFVITVLVAIGIFFILGYAMLNRVDSLILGIIFFWIAYYLYKKSRK